MDFLGYLGDEFIYQKNIFLILWFVTNVANVVRPSTKNQIT